MNQETLVGIQSPHDYMCTWETYWGGGHGGGAGGRHPGRVDHCARRARQLYHPGRTP